MQWGKYRSDLKQIFLLAYPIILTSAVDTVMMMVDRLFLARVTGISSELSLGAAMGGAAIAMIFQSPLFGFLQYTNAMSSQSFGRRDYQRCSSITVQGFYWVLLYYPFLLLIVRFIPHVLRFMQHDPRLAALEYEYARILIAGQLITLARLPLNSFFIATNRSYIVMIASLAGLLANVPLDYIFIFGGLRVPALGLQGAAIATVISQTLVFFILFICFLMQKYQYRIRKAWRISPSVHLELLRFATPAAFDSTINSLCFNLFLMLFYSLGPMVAAAGTITFSWDLVNFIILLGFGTATTTLVGQSLGAGNLERARHLRRMVLTLALSYSSFISFWFIFTPDLLINVFISESTQNPEALRVLSRQMMRLSALYLLTDALSTVYRGALVGAGDTFVIMLIAIFWHLILAIGTWVLVRILDQPPILVWAGFVVFVLFLGISWVLRYYLGTWQKRWANSARQEGSA